MEKEGYVDFDKKHYLSKTEVEEIQTQFSMVNNIVKTNSFGDSLRKWEKKVKDEIFTKFYFNIPAFFDPEHGFITVFCRLMELHEEALKNKKDITFGMVLDMGVNAPDHLSKLLNYKCTAWGLKKLVNLALGYFSKQYLVMFWNYYKFSILPSLGGFLLPAAQFLGVTIVFCAILVGVQIYKNKQAEKGAQERLDQMNAMKMKLSNAFSRGNFSEILEECNIIEIIIAEKLKGKEKNDIPDEEKTQIHFYYLPDVPEAFPLSKDVNDEKRIFYLEISRLANESILTAKDLEDLKNRYKEKFMGLEIYNKITKEKEEKTQSLVEKMRQKLAENPNDATAKEILKSLGYDK